MMENSYEKNMEALLQKAFLAQDFDAPKNEVLVNSSAQATLKSGRGMLSITQSGWFKSLLFLSITIIAFFIGNQLIAEDTGNYSPKLWTYQLPKVEPEVMNSIPSKQTAELHSRQQNPQLKKGEEMVFSKTLIPEDSIKIYSPEKVVGELPQLTEEQIVEHKKEKVAYLKSILRLSKDLVAEVNVFTQMLRKGERKLNDFVIWTGEVSNKEYRIFLNDLLIQNKMEAFHLAKVDEIGWTKFSEKSYMEPITQLYFSHPSYNDYPVVNVSRKGAELFCEWLTQEIKASTKNKHELFEVKIPNNREWEYAASSGNPNYIYSWGNPYVRNSKGCFLANFKPYKDSSSQNMNTCGWEDGGMLTVNSHSYTPNDFGLFNMSGNVSEMVNYPYEGNQIGARGGDWNSVREDIKIRGKDKYIGVSKALPTIGFRPIITYKESRTTLNSSEKNIHLTAIEKEENDKRKAKMIKDIKRLNHDLYTDVIRGKMKLNGKEVTTNPFFASKFEVTNLDYKTFLFDLIAQERWDDYRRAKPDFKQWNQLSLYDKIYPQEYFTSPGFGKYPVVNISAEGANLYGKWLFEEVKKVGSKGVIPSITSIRIPSYEEWMVMASVNGTFQTYSWPTDRYRVSTHDVKQESYMANFYSGKEGPIGIGDNARFTNLVGSYYPNRLGIYDLCGNVSEIIQYEDGDFGSKGGSWKSTHEEININAKDSTKGQLEVSPETGFRVILEMRTEKDGIGLTGQKAYPSLTEEQILANNKRKANMIRQLIKWNNKVYTSLLYDSSQFNSNNHSFEGVTMKKHEVSNLEYKTFLFDLIQQRRYKEFELAKPDQKLWREELKESSAYEEHYFLHPSFQNYPVVNISVQAAEMFAHWLFDEAKQADVKNQLRYAKGARLPSDKEWMDAASNFGEHKKYPWKDEKLKSDSKKTPAVLMANFIRQDSSFRNRNGQLLDTEMTTPVHSYWPNSLGIYNLSGNVAEMIRYKDGTYGSKGGSWKSFAKEIEIHSPDMTKGNITASPTLGFRYVIEWELRREKGELVGVKAMNK